MATAVPLATAAAVELTRSNRSSLLRLPWNNSVTNLYRFRPEKEKKKTLIVNVICQADTMCN